MRRQNDAYKSAVGGIIGGGAFLVFLFVLKTTIWISIVMGVLVYVGINLLFYSYWGKVIIEPDAGVSSEEFSEQITEARDKVRQITALARKAGKDNIRENISDIAELGNCIIDEMERNPATFRDAKRFLNYYLDTTLKIVTMYVEISSRHLTSESRQSLSKIEGILGTVKGAFEKQLAQVQKNELLSLEVEIELLEKTIKMEGL